MSSEVSGTASLRDGDLELASGDRVLRYPAIWLRDNCPCAGCAGCADPLSGQKLHDITDIAPDCPVTRIGQIDNSKKRSTATGTSGGGGAIRVRFAPDGHVGEFSLAWLAGNALGTGALDEDDGRVLWDSPADLRPVRTGWAGYLAGPRQREQVLGAVVRDGFALLTSVPPDDGGVLAVAQSFGFVRETNYGRLFDVRIEPAPGNLAFTSREILQ